MRAFFICIATLLPSTQFGCATAQKSSEMRKLPRAPDATIPKPNLRLVGVTNGMPLDRMTTLASFKILRHISMFYKLDLFKDNHYSPTMAQTIRMYEDKVRECYVSRLDEIPGLRGQIALSFSVSKTTGGMQKIEKIGGNLNDFPLVNCLTRELASLPINPPKSMRGRLLYSFSADETVAKTP